MTRARELLCPNCGGPLPAASGRTSVECTYCGRPALLETRPPNAPPPSHVPYAVVRHTPQTVSRAPLFVTVIVIGIGIASAVLIFTSVNRQVSKQHETQRAVQSEIQGLIGAAQQSAGQGQAEALAEMERALGQLPQQFEATQDQAALARRLREQSRQLAEREAASARERPAPKKPAPPPLPAAVELATVERALAKLDVSHCPGPGFIVYTFRVDPSGALKTISQGPMRIDGSSFGCVGKVVDEAKQSLTFPRTRNGSGTVQRRFDLPE
ncbi:MAG TPA: hypothetical protein VML75_18820 [Kofleriaceae bacterium]|nr:hypothetical protein [Kofleriaceae bacterium]